MQEITLNDIANELLIINKYTIDKLFQLDNSADCVSLYVFYYKTAKWQKTNIIKANDEYVSKCLKWGTKKIRETKKKLKENGLIDIVQRRENGKIIGWYIQVSYLVSKKNIEDIKIIVESNNAQNQQVVESTSELQEINTLKQYIKCLKEEIEMLKNKNNKKNKKETEFDQLINQNFTDEELKNTIYEFIKMRKAIKKPLTTRGLELMIKKLYSLSTNIDEQIQILNNSIMNNWQGIFPLKKEINKDNKGSFNDFIDMWKEAKDEEKRNDTDNNTFSW